MLSESDFKANLQRELFSVADGCVAPGDFGPHFVPKWFWKIGQPYCFVFKKNLRITNIQVAELFSLLRSHVRSSNIQLDLRISSIPAFEKQLSRFTETFSEDLQDIRESLRAGTQRIVDLYLDYFANLCLIDLHFGSCLMSISPLYTIDLESICFLSGYIHSCGPCIYARDIYHCRYPRFRTHIVNYLDSLERPKDSKPILFRPYSHEDFTKHDRNQEEDLASGLDELKLHSTKQYAGDLVLATMVENLRQEETLKTRLTVAKPGHSGLDKHLAGTVDPARTFWLIMDRPLVRSDDKHSASFADARIRSNRHTLICYDQQILNDNPFHIFDENKPGWYDHTTIPHTLMGAMINISRPHWPTGRPVNICDPFSGGGTAWLESCKFHDVSYTGFDLEPIARVVSIDNLEFFSTSLRDLDAIHASVKRTFDKYLTPPQELDEVWEWNTSAEKKLVDWSQKLLDNVLAKNQSLEDITFDDEVLDELQNPEIPILGRLLFYTMLKAHRRFSAALRTNQIDQNAVVGKELGRLNNQIKRFRAMREQMDTKQLRNDKSRLVFEGKYSNACSIAPEWLRRNLDGCPIEVRGIDQMEDKNKYDVMVTDPPYGFNTHENIEKLVSVYKSGIDKMIRALTPYGQLVIALPDWSHTGRRIPAFAFKEFVTYTVLQSARKQGREAYHASAHLPRLSVSILPPYYWESERALRRAILHFRFQPQVGLG